MIDFDVFDKDRNRRDFQWLQDKFKVEFKDADPGKKFKLVRVDEIEGPTVFIVQVRNEQGEAHRNQPVAFSWKEVNELSNAVDLTQDPNLKSRWHTHALIQNTNNNGDTGFGFGGGSVIKADGGSHTLWVLSQSLKSDALAKVGWLGGTDHIDPNRLTFQIVDEPDVGGPDIGDDETDDLIGDNDSEQPNPSNRELIAKIDSLHSDLRKLMNHFGL